MYLSYVDESGDTGINGSRHLLLGAAALFEGRWSYAQRDVQNLLQRYFPAPPRPREIHCTDVRGGREAFAPLPRTQRVALLDDFCSLASNMLDVELRMFTVIFDKAAWRTRNPGKTGDDLYLEAFENLVSRIDLFLRRRHAEGRPSKTIMIVDPHSTSMCAALKRALGGFQDAGTRWDSLYNVVETVVFLESHESPGLQLADLCSYAVWRLVEFGDDGLARKIASIFDREPAAGAVNPGKWHGVKYFGNDSTVAARVKTVWP